MSVATSDPRTVAATHEHVLADGTLIVTASPRSPEAALVDGDPWMALCYLSDGVDAQVKDLQPLLRTMLELHVEEFGER